MLLLLMSVLTQTFFTLVGGHLMSFSLFTAWHKLSLLNVGFNFCNESFGRFESWNIMSRNYNGGIF